MSDAFNKLMAMAEPKKESLEMTPAYLGTLLNQVKLKVRSEALAMIDVVDAECERVFQHTLKLAKGGVASAGVDKEGKPDGK